MTDHPRNGNGAMDEQTRIEAELRERFPPECMYDLMVHVAARSEMALRAIDALKERIADVEENGCGRACASLAALSGARE